MMGIVAERGKHQNLLLAGGMLIGTVEKSDQPEGKTDLKVGDKIAT